MDHSHNPSQLGRLEAFLPPEEQEEAGRSRRARDRRRFAFGRIPTRFALSQHCDARPDVWRFDRDHAGRPFIVVPEEFRAIRFSISRTEGLTACHADLALLYREVLSPAEGAALTKLPEAQRAARLFDYWTLKESYAKARGIGLGFTLSRIGFDLGLRDAIRASFGANLDDDPAEWVFRRLRLQPQYAGGGCSQEAPWRWLRDHSPAGHGSKIVAEDSKLPIV